LFITSSSSVVEISSVAFIEERPTFHDLLELVGCPSNRFSSGCSCCHPIALFLHYCERLWVEWWLNSCLCLWSEYLIPYFQHNFFACLRLLWYVAISSLYFRSLSLISRSYWNSVNYQFCLPIWSPRRYHLLVKHKPSFKLLNTF